MEQVTAGGLASGSSMRRRIAISSYSTRVKTGVIYTVQILVLRIIGKIDAYRIKLTRIPNHSAD